MTASDGQSAGPVGLTHTSAAIPIGPPSGPERLPSYQGQSSPEANVIDTAVGTDETEPAPELEDPEPELDDPNPELDPAPELELDDPDPELDPVPELELDDPPPEPEPPIPIVTSDPPPSLALPAVPVAPPHAAPDEAITIKLATLMTRKTNPPRDESRDDTI